MKFIKSILLLSMFSIYCIDAKEPHKSWTILIYIAADNNLYAPYSLDNIKQLQKIGTNDFANILVYYCRHPQGEDKVGQRIIVYQDHLEIVQTDLNADSGSEQTALDACAWATEFPSDHIMFGFWDHGSGVLNPTKRGVCFDDTTGNYLTDINLKNILRTITKDYLRGKKVDIVGFDACLMAGIEFFSTLAPYAEYVVASEESIPGAGWNYTYAFAPLAKGPLAADQLAEQCITGYNKAYRYSGQSYTLSAIKSSIIEYLAKNVDSLAQTLSTLLEQQVDNSVSDMLAQSSAPGKCIRFDIEDYADLKMLYTNLLKNSGMIKLKDAQQAKLLQSSFKKILINGLMLIKRCVLAQVYSRNYNQVGGVSLYYPLGQIHASYSVLDWTERHPAWLQLLEQGMRKYIIQ